MVYVFLADGFEEIEALATVDVLRRANLTVTTVGIGTLTVRGAHGILVSADVLDADVCLENMTAMVLPGGMPGTRNLESSQVVQTAIQHAVSKQLPIGAICAAPSIIGHLDLLRGRNATCYPGFEADLHGAVITDEAVVTDGLFTTASGAGVAIDFALELVSRLSTPNMAHDIREAMQCR